jgi:prophage DNA circulation protein
MSDWLNTLQTASFRGLQFHVDEPPEVQVGRRSANHEYAAREEPYSEDMGRKQRSYTIAGGVSGRDFIAKAIALQEAFETQGPGLLVHPHYGELMVTCEATIKFESRYASFTATFKEAGTNTNPSTKIDTKRSVLNSAIVAQSAAINDFTSILDLTGPAFIAESFISQAIEVMNNLSGAVDNIRSLVLLPEQFASQIFSNVHLLQASQATTSSAVSVISQLISPSITDGETVTDIASTQSQQKIANNDQALNLLTGQAAAVSLAKTAVELDFTDQADAVSTIKEVTKTIEQVSWQSADDSYQALNDLRINVQQDMQERVPKLPDTVVVKLPQATPTLVIAYQNQGSIANEQSIIDRNRIANPGFVIGEVEVING